MKVERWLELRLQAPDADPGVLVEALMDQGGRAVWEEDGWQVTHLPDPGEAGVQTCIEALFQSLPGVDDLRVETRWQHQEDWDAFWKRGLEPRRLTDRLVVTPSWMEPETRPGDLVITLDPKMAFGNAEHGTSRGCLRLMDGLVLEGDSLLDVGAGSAILSIAGALLGAASVDALEVDPLALPAARENVERNGVAGRVHLREQRVTSHDLSEMEPYDGVLANLETGFLRPLLPGLVHAVRPGGWLLLSGILDHEWESLRADTEAHGVDFQAVDADGEWRSGLFRRPGE